MNGYFFCFACFKDVIESVAILLCVFFFSTEYFANTFWREARQKMHFIHSNVMIKYLQQIDAMYLNFGISLLTWAMEFLKSPL